MVIWVYEPDAMLKDQIIIVNKYQLLTLFLPAKKVTLKTGHGQNQPMCK